MTAASRRPSGPTDTPPPDGWAPYERSAIVALARGNPARWADVSRLVLTSADLLGLWDQDLLEVAVHDADLADARALLARATWQDVTEWAGRLEGVVAASVRVPTLADHAYPRLLRAAWPRPPYVTVRGQLPDTGAVPSVAVTGSAEPSSAERARACLAGRRLAQAGVAVVVSAGPGAGRHAATAALAVGGQVVAVLDRGLRAASAPTTMGALAGRDRWWAQLLARGAVVAPCWPGTPATAASVAAHDATLTGLAYELLVVGGRTDRRALAVAAAAGRQARPVWLDVTVADGDRWAHRWAGSRGSDDQALILDAAGCLAPLIAHATRTAAGSRRLARELAAAQALEAADGAATAGLPGDDPAGGGARWRATQKAMLAEERGRPATAQARAMPAGGEVPALGWRAWRIGVPERARGAWTLVSDAPGPVPGGAAVAWPANGPLIASARGCRASWQRRPPHQPPAAGCACGIHAAVWLGATLCRQGRHDVVGVAAGSGRVLHDGWGWRAATARPVALLPVVVGGDQQEPIMRLAGRYGLRLLPVDPDRLDLPAGEYAATSGPWDGCWWRRARFTGRYPAAQIADLAAVAACPSVTSEGLAVPAVKDAATRLVTATIAGRHGAPARLCGPVRVRPMWQHAASPDGPPEHWHVSGTLLVPDRPPWPATGSPVELTSTGTPR